MNSLLFSAVCFALDFHACLDLHFSHVFTTVVGDMKFCTVFEFLFPAFASSKHRTRSAVPTILPPSPPWEGEGKCVTRHALCAKVASQLRLQTQTRSGYGFTPFNSQLREQKEREPVHDNLCCDMFFQLVHSQLRCTCRSSLCVQVAHANSHVVSSTFLTFVGVV